MVDIVVLEINSILISLFKKNFKWNFYKNSSIHSTKVSSGGQGPMNECIKHSRLSSHHFNALPANKQEKKKDFS